MAKEPAKPATDDGSEYNRFEQTLRDLLTVPKRDIDEAVERERQARANGNGK